MYKTPSSVLARDEMDAKNTVKCSCSPAVMDRGFLDVRHGRCVLTLPGETKQNKQTNTKEAVVSNLRPTTHPLFKTPDATFHIRSC